VSPSLAAGPIRMMLLDRATGDRTWGNGLRFGAGAQYRVGPVAIYADLYREVVAFGGGAAAGPVRMMLLDRSSGERTWGNGLRFGAGAQYRVGPVAIYADLYREVVAFGGGAAQGTTSLDGLTVGLALQPR